MPLKPREIWKKGTPLNDAWWAFSDAELPEFDEITQTNPDLRLSECHSRTDRIVAVQRALQAVLHPLQERSRVAQDMKSALTEQLREGCLIAYGYQIRPSKGRSPSRVEADIWTSLKINWDDASASNQSIEFHRIRIVAPEDYPEISTKPKLGRPSNGKLIQRQAYLLFKDNPKFVDFPNKDKALAVRNEIKGDYPEIDVYGKGFGDDAIRKHIKVIENQFKKSLNSN